MPGGPRSRSYRGHDADPFNKNRRPGLSWPPFLRRCNGVGAGFGIGGIKNPLVKNVAHRPNFAPLTKRFLGSRGPQKTRGAVWKDPPGEKMAAWPLCKRASASRRAFTSFFQKQARAARGPRPGGAGWHRGRGTPYPRMILRGGMCRCPTALLSFAFIYRAPPHPACMRVEAE